MTQHKINVLDHGFVILRNLAGPTRRTHNMVTVDDAGDGLPLTSPHIRPFDADDTDPANAARMSFDQMDSGRSYEDEMRLNEYLLKNEHTSPFEMISVWVEVKVPIFIDRQMVRHRTWRRNESSGRYITLPGEWYIPETVGGKTKDKKQGQDDNLDAETQEWFKESLRTRCAADYMTYLHAIRRGVAPEHARMFLHLNHYVHWLGNVDLANLFKFMRLRAHNHAQIEAQRYAETIVTLLRPHLPGLMSLFDKHVRK
jgi:thymidylate synthase (FAD)